MDEKLENISILNVVSYILFVFADLIEKPVMLHIAAAGIFISFLSSLWLLISARRMKNDKEKSRVVRCINSIVFCVFFLLYYIVKV